MNIKKCSSNDDEKADSPNDSNPNDEKENLTESIQRAYQLSHTWWLCEPSSFQSAAAAVLCSVFLLHDEYNKVSMWQFTGENRESLGTVN